jgi:hypothetical protein
MPKKIEFPKYRNIVFNSADLVDGEQYDEDIGWYRFCGTPSLMFIHLVFYASGPAASEIWNHQDGMPGMDPDVVEWDWSAIRDSSPEAKERMLTVAKKYADFNKFMCHLDHCKGE